MDFFRLVVWHLILSGKFCHNIPTVVSILVINIVTTQRHSHQKSYMSKTINNWPKVQNTYRLRDVAQHYGGQPDGET